MKDYKYDYSRKSFKTIEKDGITKYYLRVNREYIEVSEDVFKVCRSSYDKARHTYQMEVAKSVLYFEDIDLATFFVSIQQKSILDEIIIHDLYRRVIEIIDEFDELNRTIFHLSFIEKKSTRDIGVELGMSHAGVIYRLKKIRKILREKLSNYLPFNE